MRRQGSQVSMRVARGSASWLSSHGRGPDPSSKATLWVKAQHEGALPPPCTGLLEPPERPQGSPASSSVWREDPVFQSKLSSQVNTLLSQHHTEQRKAEGKVGGNDVRPPRSDAGLPTGRRTGAPRDLGSTPPRTLTPGSVLCQLVQGQGQLRPWRACRQAREMPQGASRAAPGKSGLHAHGEGLNTRE